MNNFMGLMKDSEIGTTAQSVLIMHGPTLQTPIFLQPLDVGL